MPARSALLLLVPLALLTHLPAQSTPPPPSPPAASAQTANPAPLSSFTMDGTVGPYPIRLNYTLRNGTELVAAHYFYTSRLLDIPLLGTVRGHTVDLSGTDGSFFHLTFVGNTTSGPGPLTFSNAIGLRGTWTQPTPNQPAKTLPVTLTLGGSTANPGDRLYAQVTDASDASFELMVRGTRDAILANDLDSLAAHVHFPLRINTRPTLVLHTPAELRARWPRIATPAFLQAVRATVPHELFVHNGEAMLGNGILWFDNKGLTSVNPTTR